MPLTEWELSTNIAALINQMIGKGRILPFSKVRCERKPDGPGGSPVLTLLGGLGQILVTGEVRPPYHETGSSPFNPTFVNDARAKACKVSSRYFFTCNLNECVLWETPPNRALCWEDRNYEFWEVMESFREGDMDRPEVSEHLKNWLWGFLHEVAGIIIGISSIRKKTIDEKFAEIIKSALKIPILATSGELEKQCANNEFKSELIQWAGEDQHCISSDPDSQPRDFFEQAARFACSNLADRLAAHAALLSRRGRGDIDKISVPDYVNSAEALRNHIMGYFADAAGISGDHAEFFSGTSIGNRIAFCSDSAVPYWRDLVASINSFNFAGLEDEVVNGMLQKLMAHGGRDESVWLHAPAVSNDVPRSAATIVEEEGAAGIASGDETTGAKKNKKRAGRYEEITAQVVDEIKAECPAMLRRYDPDFLDRRKPFDTFELPGEGDAEPYRDLFKSRGVLFKKGKKHIAFLETRNPAQDNIVVEVANAGIRGFVRFPKDEDECERVWRLFSGFLADRLQVVRKLVEKRTGSGQVQEKACSAVMKVINGRK